MSEDHELLKALWTRLMAVYERGDGVGTPKSVGDRWDAVTRECLRQMKYAHFEGFDGDRDKPYDVTLAPDDWQP